MKLLTLTIPGYGQIQPPPSVPDPNTPIGVYIGWALGIFIFAGIMASLGFIIFGGFKWITSGGDKKALEESRKTLIYAVIGLIAMFLSMVAVSFIGTILGVKYL